MTIYNLWIFDEKGTLLFYREWLRKKHTSMDREQVCFDHFLWFHLRIHYLFNLGLFLHIYHCLAEKFLEF